ncbi:MAG TPA: hypothetical protein VMW12_01700 [Candidatus Dormibacteraeota bacterium]|nr:hypothetical protein [Candidatus Dormibacteraeota bacterium]
MYARPLYCRIAVLALALALFGAFGLQSAGAAQMPPYMNVIVGHPATTKEGVAQQNVLSLDLSMFSYYDSALASFQQNLLAQHPVLMALFSGSGGKMILYRPGKAPLDAPSVPIVYQLLKSVGHSTMALFELSGPHLDNSADQSWVAMMKSDRTEQQSALDTIGDISVNPAWRNTMKSVLANNIAFMDKELSKGVISYDDIHAFAHQQSPLLAKCVTWAAHTQVDHWMGVVAGWKHLLGKDDWDKTYALSNTIYVARQNNVLFSVLAQFFGPSAMNTRLMLFETTDFTTTPDAMMTALTRVIADRSVGEEFFGNYYLMDYELMGGDARAAIIAGDKKLGIPEYLPPLVPFGSHEWPVKITPGAGPATIEQLQRQP